MIDLMRKLLRRPRKTDDRQRAILSTGRATNRRPEESWAAALDRLAMPHPRCPVCNALAHIDYIDVGTSQTGPRLVPGLMCCPNGCTPQTS